MADDADYGLVARLRALRDLLRRGGQSKADICRRLPHYYRLSSAGSRRLGRDVRALRQLGYSIHVDRPTQTYSLAESPYLALSKDDVEALALIRESFAGLHLKSQDVIAVLQKVVSALPEEQQAHYFQQPAVAITLHPAVDYRPHAKTTRLLEQAIDQRRKVRFVYPSLDDGKPIVYVAIEPYEIQFFDRHFYLVGLSPDESQISEFRLDRIRDIELMPGRVAAKRKRPMVAFSYRLSPHITRLGVSERFVNQQAAPQADGSVIVRAEGYSEFRIIQDLLRYGEHAELLGPPKLRAKMAQVSRAMAEQYAKGPDK